MKDLTINTSGNADKNPSNALNPELQPDLNLHENESDFLAFNITLLHSLPYPAMYIRRKDRVIIAANDLAMQFGVKPGGYCWREFGKEKFISEEDRILISSFPTKIPDHFKIKCSFCCSDSCFDITPCQNVAELEAHGKIWDTFWIKVSEDIFLHYFIDITDRKRLEESLRKSEQFLRQTQQIAKIGTYSFDINTGKWESSEILDNIFGIEFQPQKTIEDWISYIHPDMKKIVVDYYNDNVLKNKNRFDLEYKIIRQNDGEVYWVHEIGDLEFDKNGQPVKMIGIIRDITERKQEQIKLIRNLKFTEALLESVPIPIFAKDSNGLYINCNKSFTNQCGVSKDQLVGKSVYEVWPVEMAEDYSRSDLEIISNQKFLTYEAQIVDVNKQVRDVIFSKNVFYDENGVVAGIVGTNVDITDMKQAVSELSKSEQMLQAVLDHFPGVVFWKDKYSTYMGCNQAFAEGAGLKNPSEIIGKTDFDLPWKETEAEMYRADDREVIENEKTKLHIIETQLQADQKVIWFDTSKIPFHDPEGNVVGVIGMSSDITERKSKEEENSLLLACVENTDDRVVVKGLDLRVLAANRAWVHSRGKSDVKELLGKTDAEVMGISPEIEPVRTYMEDERKAQKLKQGEYMIKEQPLRLFNGIDTIALVKRYPIFNDKGKLLGTGTISTDITERKKTENALRKSERRYKLLSDNITDGIFTCRKGRLEFVNKSMSQIFDYEESDLENMQLLDLIIPERRNDFEMFISFDSNSDQINSIEIECVKKDNSTIFVEIFLNYVASENLIYGVLHDVTQKRRIQERNIIKAIIQTEENERSNFSKELHDGLGPLLSTIKLYLQWSNRPKTNKSRKEIIGKAEEILEEALITVKEISNKLSPHLLTNYGDFCYSKFRE
jgi:PAS domain S-box